MRRLEKKGWDADTTRALENLLNECEMNLYTPAYDAANMQQLLRQAESLLGVLISHTSYRMEVFGIAAVLLEVFTEVQYEIVDGPGGRIDIVSPHGL